MGLYGSSPLLFSKNLRKSFSLIIYHIEKQLFTYNTTSIYITFYLVVEVPLSLYNMLI